MRVIGGEFRSRVLKTLPGLEVRPTPDRMRETLFNILAPMIEGATFADVYAGTGSVGIEALSRGAAKAIFIEENRDACDVIRANLKSLGLEGRARVIQARASASLAAIDAGIVFIDPPYPMVNEYAKCLEILARRPAKLAIVQHPWRLELPELLKRTRVVRQGDNALSFFGGG
jgi:16S rRNA (guanine966-N2)-methyltransferase